MPELSIWVIANKSTLTLLARRPSINARSRLRKAGEDSISTRPDRYTRAPSLFSTMLMPRVPPLWVLLLCKGNLSFRTFKGFLYGNLHRIQLDRKNLAVVLANRWPQQGSCNSKLVKHLGKGGPECAQGQ